MLKMSKEFEYLEEILNMALEGWKGRIHVRMVGSRWSSKTKSGEIFGLKGLYLPISFQMLVAKYDVKKSRAIHKEFIDTALYYKTDDLTINLSNTTLKYKKNEIMTVGYKTNRSQAQGQLGQFRPIDPDLLVVMIDEISEWVSSKERSLVWQAAGAGKLTVYIDTTNPWSEFNWFIKESANKMPFVEETMRLKGQQYKVIVKKLDKENKSIDIEILHYTNHYINEFLSPEQHELLKKEWEIDPDTARVTDLGMPGIEQGAIYSFQAPKVRKYLPLENVTNMIGGMDWINTNNHVVALFATVSEDNLGVERINIEEAFIYGYATRYYFNSLMPEATWEPYQHPDIHELIVAFYEQAYKKWAQHNAYRLEIGIDNANEEAMNSINRVFAKNELDGLFEVHKATKKQIKERINIIKNAAGKDILKINPRLTPVIGAFEALKWAENTNSTDPRDKVDQLVIDINDALDYLVSKRASKIIKE